MCYIKHKLFHYYAKISVGEPSLLEGAEAGKNKLQ